MNNKGIITFGSILAIGFIVAASVVAGVFYKIKSLDSTISVTGSSEKIIQSDTAKWRASFSRTINFANTNSSPLVNEDFKSIPVEAQIKNVNDQLAKDLVQVQKYLKENKVDAKSIKVNPVTVTPINEQGSYGPSARVIGYTLTQQVTVEDSNIQNITRVAQNSSSLLNQGIIFTSEPIEYYYSKLSELKLDMLAEATENAKNRAGKIAQSSNSKVGNLRSASMGVFQIMSVNSTDISDYGSYDVSSIEKKVMAVVKASFLLK